jgi:hypothetical protein
VLPESNNTLNVSRAGSGALVGSVKRSTLDKKRKVLYKKHTACFGAEFGGLLCQDCFSRVLLTKKVF